MLEVFYPRQRQLHVVSHALVYKFPILKFVYKFAFFPQVGKLPALLLSELFFTTTLSTFCNSNYPLCYFFQVIINKPQAPKFSFGVRHSEYTTPMISEPSD